MVKRPPMPFSTHVWRHATFSFFSLPHFLLPFSLFSSEIRWELPSLLSSSSSSFPLWPLGDRRRRRRKRRRRRRRRRRRGCLGINFDLLLGSAGLDILVYSRVSTNRFYCVPVFNQLVELGKSMFFVHKILCNTPWMHSKTRLSKIKYPEFLGFIANGKTTSVVESFGRSRDEEREGGGGGGGGCGSEKRRRGIQWRGRRRRPSPTGKVQCLKNQKSLAF